MAGGKGKIHEHPNAGKSTFAERKQDINRTGLNRKSIASVNLELEKKGCKAANKQDIVDCYLRLINIDLPELTKMIKDDKQPAMIRIVGKAILSGKGFDIIEKMLDRGIGKPDSKLTLDGGINVTNKQEYSEFSTEDLKAIEEISKKYEKKRD